MWLTLHDERRAWKSFDRAVKDRLYGSGLICDPANKAKSMVLDPRDVNGRNAGSFFKNPIVPEREAARVRELCVREGLVAEEREVPCFAAGSGQIKLAAGFLIERAGIQRGMRRGSVGVSTRHALCLVHHGGGQTRDLLEFASEIQAKVEARFGLRLELEPICW